MSRLLSAPSTVKPLFDLMPAALSVVAGMVDVTGWLLLNGLFTAHITGNLVVGVADVVRGGHPSVAQTLAIPVFIVAVALANALAKRFGTCTRATRIWLLSIQTVLLCLTQCVSLVALWSDFPPEKWLSLLEGMLAVGAMAVQNALVHVTRKKVPTTAVMTGNIVVATIALMDIASVDTRRQAFANWMSSCPLLAGFLLGCLIGAGDVHLLSRFAWSVTALASLLCLCCYGRQAPDLFPDDLEDAHA